jgi:hypothetical protein
VEKDDIFDEGARKTKTRLDGVDKGKMRAKVVTKWREGKEMGHKVMEKIGQEKGKGRAGYDGKSKGKLKPSYSTFIISGIPPYESPEPSRQSKESSEFLDSSLPLEL